MTDDKVQPLQKYEDNKIQIEGVRTGSTDVNVWEVIQNTHEQQTNRRHCAKT